MPRILISFIGKGQQPRNSSGASTGTARYLEATYEFPDHSQRTSRFFGLSLWQYLRTTPSKPDAWLIFGTSASNWCDLEDGLSDQCDNPAYKAVFDWCSRIRDAVKTGAVTEDDLRRAPIELAAGLGVAKLHLALIASGLTQPEQEGLMRTLMRYVQCNDKVILDITHAFRHLPLLVGFMLFALREYRNVAVEQVYYGQLENMNPVKPAIELSVCGDYFRLGNALSTLSITGDYLDASGQLFNPDLHRKLTEIDFAERTNRFQTAMRQAEAVLPQMAAQQFSDPLRTGVAESLRETLAPTGDPKLTPERRMVLKAKYCAARHDYMAALTLAWEAVVLHASTRLPQTPASGQYDEAQRQAALKLLDQHLSGANAAVCRKLRQLRNAVVHGTTPTGPVGNALRNQSAFHGLLDTCLEFAENLTEGRIR